MIGSLFLFHSIYYMIEENNLEVFTWSIFEEHLGKVNDNAIIREYDYDLGLEIEEYDIPMDIYLLADQVRKAFVLWVSETLDVRQNYKIINKHKKDFRTSAIKFSNYDKSDIDYPYLEQVKTRWTDASWRFSFFTAEDGDKIDAVAQKLGIVEAQYIKFEFRNDKAENVEMEIVNDLGTIKLKRWENKDILCR